jgi:hypothetical protein
VANTEHSYIDREPHNVGHKSYILSRHFLVKVGTDQSALTSLNAGVPQGSELGPLLYLLYMANLPTSPGTLTAIFADDTSIHTTDSDPVVALQPMKQSRPMSPSLCAVRPARRFISTMFNFLNQMTSNILGST